MGMMLVPVCEPVVWAPPIVALLDGVAVEEIVEVLTLVGFWAPQGWFCRQLAAQLESLPQL